MRVVSSEDSQKWFAKHAEMTRQQRATWDKFARFRFSPRPERWREILLTVGVLYGLFVGVPAAGGIWAAIEIYRRTSGR